MRILVVIPHYYRATDPNAVNRSLQPDTRHERVAALKATLVTLHRTFAVPAYGLDYGHQALWQTAPTAPHVLDIVVCTQGSDHLLNELTETQGLFRHVEVACDPLMLGFECHRIMAEARDGYDYYFYLEDDIAVTDPLFFRKRRLFDAAFGPEALLQPNRFEIGVLTSAQGKIPPAPPGYPQEQARKIYIDFNLKPEFTRAFQDVSQHPKLWLPFIDETIQFQRSYYPSAGCFLLNAAQLRLWADGPFFLDRDVSYLSPLDSAVTLSVMRSFRIYKSTLDQAAFWEVQHISPRWTNQVGVLPVVVREAPFAPLLVNGQPFI